MVTTMTPNHGKPGAHVTLHGVGLEKATIKFGSKTATVVTAGAKSAVVIVPQGSQTQSVTASDPMCTGTHLTSFKYWPSVRIRSRGDVGHRRGRRGLRSSTPKVNSLSSSP